MRVCVLGEIAAGPSGRIRPIVGPIQRRVLAALVARRNETLHVSALVDACWPDGPPPTRSEHNVRTYVHRVRRAIGDDGELIETISSGYRMTTTDGEVDADEFSRLARTASQTLAVGDAVATIDAAEQALALWRGPPYAEFGDQPWAVPEAAHLDELHVGIRTDRCEALLELGKPAAAVTELEQLTREDPLRERPRALLMRALYDSGRQVEALREFQRYRRLLVEEAGVEPSPELVELDRRLATGGSIATPRTVGSYLLHERIGAGAFAVVHRATQRTLGRDVAIKIVRAELADNPRFIRRFEAEAQMVASIEHPNVVPLYDYWREPGQAFLVMRWMTGGSLETRLDDGPWSVEATADLVDQIAAALDAAHAREVVHRDVKPANILFDDAGRAFLGDFGIALAAEERATPAAAPSEGSPTCAAPEQLRREPVGPEADVHALAIVAYTMLTGRTPFVDAPNAATVLRHRPHDPVPPVSRCRPGLSAAFDEVIAVATAKQAEERYTSAGAFAAEFRGAVGRTAGATALATAAPQSTQVGERANPYRALRAFTEADAGHFYGRNRLVDELVGACSDPSRRLVSVVGPSGSGKSSVVRAGLVPALRAGRVDGSADWFITTMIPGGHPYEAMETALLRVATNPPSALLGQLRDDERGIHRGVRRVLPDDDGTVLVVIDQFEELFTATEDTERRSFLRALAAAVTEPDGPLRIVLTMRADFFDQPLRQPEFAALFKQSTVAITPLAPDELEQAISAPAADVGVDFERGLIAEIIADVNSQPGALPLLQYALTQTFDATDADTITATTYHRVGGLTGALTRRAETLHAESADDEQHAARQLFERLVTLGEGSDDTRRRIRRSEMPAHATTERVIERYGAARLIAFDHDPATREPTIEIAHEALIREWPRLRDWLDEDRDALRAHRHLTSAATAWKERDRDVNELYRGGRLDTAESLLSGEKLVLNPLESEYLAASIERREALANAEHRRIRRLRRLTAVTAIVAVVAVVTGVIAVVQGRRATAERDARDLVRLRTEAVALSERIPRAGVLLAIEADRADPSVHTKDALHRTLTSSSTTAWNHLEETVDLDDDQVELLADPGTRLHLAFREGGNVVLSAVETPSGASGVTRHEHTGTGWRSTQIGQLALVAGTGDHTLWVGDLITLIGPDEQPTDLSIPRPNDLVAFAVSGNGEVISLAHADGTLDLYDADGARLGTLQFPSPEGLADRRVRIDLSDDGAMLAAQVDGETAGGAWLFATTQPPAVVDSGTTITSLDILTKPLQRPFVSGRSLYVSPPQTNYLSPVDPSTGDVDGPRLVGHTSSITDVAESEAMGLVATASLDGTVRVWDLSTGRPLGRDIRANTQDIVFDARGRLVVPHNGHLSFWTYDTSAWQEIGCAAAQRNLTRDEWEEYGPTSREYRRTCDQYPIER